MTTPLPPALVAELTARLGERFTQNPAICAQHGHDESHFPDAPPQAVAFVTTTDEVQAVARAASAHRIPLIPFAAGSSLEGHVLAPYGGIAVDFTQMNRIVAIEPENMLATVEPGVTRTQLNAALKGSGLFFPIDPGADATIGGMTATRASGTNAVRYGTMRENVLAIDAVLADGTLMHTGTKARKSSAGYDLTRLLVGSEGTLALFTAITVRLHPLPEAIAAAVCPFPTITAAVETVIGASQMGIPLARVEFLDERAVAAINRYSHTDYPETPTLFFEFHGSERGVAEQIEAVKALADDHGGGPFIWANRPEERTRLWDARHKAYFACLALRPGCRGITTDVCVPIARLAEAVTEARQLIDASGLTAPILGHVGDGNFHSLILVDPTDPAEVSRAEQLNEAIVAAALALEGTSTGEHGIGMGKKGFLRQEAGDAAVAMMRAVKSAFDPLGILNPGKIFE
ncbi:FAD-linked oxidase C-terminal domain-containing protein [Hydrogenophilus islandicus]